MQEAYDKLSTDYKSILSSKDEAGSEVEVLKKKIEDEIAKKTKKTKILIKEDSK